MNKQWRRGDYRGRAVALLSGGLDSVTAMAMAIADGWYVDLAVNVSYGQRHSRESDSAMRIAEAMDIPLRVIDFPLGDICHVSSLVGDTDVPVGRQVEDMSKGIPSTYVPMRNTFLCTIATAILEGDMGRHPDCPLWAVVIGANAVDYSGYPDCRPEYYDALRLALSRGSRFCDREGDLRLVTPIIGLTKAEIISRAVALKAPLEHTWSCYVGGERPCGECDSCKIRADGFASAGVPDPALRG